MARKNTSINIEEELWYAAKHKALDQKKTITEYLEGLLRADLKR